jgi:hypothetical protein
MPIHTVILFLKKKKLYIYSYTRKHASNKEVEDPFIYAKLFVQIHVSRKYGSTMKDMTFLFLRS